MSDKYHKPFNLTLENARELHDLIDTINRTAIKLEDDTRNLNNLFHAIKGDGVRYQEYIKG